MKTEVETEQM